MFQKDVDVPPSAPESNSNDDPQRALPTSLSRSNMEEVWKDISLSSLPHPHRHRPTTAQPVPTPGVNVLDFLTIRKDSQAPAWSGCGCVQAPATALSLGSLGSEFHCLESSVQRQRSQTPVFLSASPESVFGVEGLGYSPAAAVAPAETLGKKSSHKSGDNDRRHKRMMKNRESAARSRARKQAYTNELENKVGHLLKENAKLRRQLEKVNHHQLSTSLYIIHLQPPISFQKSTLSREL
ncbi:hypothetical protein NMG60_11024471 [Bertholletia excelsa]